MITTQRSGSTWFVELLDSHPDLLVFVDEVMIGKIAHQRNWRDPRVIPFYEYKKQNPNSVRPWSTFQYLNTLYDFPGEHKAIGFKVMYDQIAWNPEILVPIILNRFKIIHLVRENSLDILLSKKNAWKKEQRENNILHTTIEVKLPAVSLNTSSLLDKLSQQEAPVQKYEMLLKLFPNKVMTVQYDSLLQEKEKVLNSIAEFLNIKSSGISYKSDLKKISKKGYKEKIANYEEVAKLLEGTKFAKFLNEDS